MPAIQSLPNLKTVNSIIVPRLNIGMSVLLIHGSFQEYKALSGDNNGW